MEQDNDREEQSHRIQNRKKSNATKQAWKKYHYNYMKGNRKKSRENMYSFNSLAQELDENVKLIESKLEKDNVFDLKGSIVFDNIAGGITFSVDKQTGFLSIATNLPEEGGRGNYKVENGGTSQDELRVLYDNIKDELSQVAQTLDDSVKQILAKYGLKETD